MLLSSEEGNLCGKIGLLSAGKRDSAVDCTSDEKFRKFYNAAYSLPVSRFIMSWIYLQSTNDLDFIISYILDTISIVLFMPVVCFIIKNSELR